MKIKFVLLIVKFLVELFELSCKEFEKNVDADGMPLDAFNYEVSSYCLVTFRGLLKQISDYEQEIN